MDLTSASAMIKDIGILGSIVFVLFWYINIKDKNNREDTNKMFDMLEGNMKEFKEEKRQEIQELKNERKEDIQMWSRAMTLFEDVAKEFKIANLESKAKMQNIEQEVKDVKLDVSVIKDKIQ